MAALSFARLRQRPGRVDTFIRKFSDGEQFVFVDGTAHVLSGIRIGSGRSQTDYSPSQSATLRTVIDSAPRTGRFPINLLVNGRSQSFSRLELTTEFGGRPAATTTSVTFGGKKTEILSEIGFCFYFAMRINNHLTARSAYSPQVWRTVSNTRQLETLCGNYNGVSSMLRYLFNDPKVDDYIQDMFLFLTQEGWDLSLIHI